MKLVLIVVLCGVTLTSCHPSRGQAPPVPVKQQAPVAEPLVDKFNFIDVELLQLAADSHAGNIVLSPSSVKTVLSMVWEGASGHTAEEISLALRLSGPPEVQQDKLHQFQQILATYTPGPTVEVANQVFVSDRIKPSPAYVDVLSKYFATVQRVNVSSPAKAAETINTWVHNATHGLVPSLIEEESLSDKSLLLLANAIYFRGTWLQAFDAERTRSGVCFYSAGDKCGKKAVMMETIGSFKSKLIRELDATLLELPYEGGRYSMLILLPEREDGMLQMVRDLAYGNLLHVLNTDLEESEYIVAVPRFSIEYHTDLVPILNRLRVIDVFTPSANLTRLVKQDPKSPVVQPAVSNVFHKAKILVDEKGATAAGVSGALVVPLMGGPQPRFIADHPFLFFIRDSRTGSFLFAGRVSEPESGAPDAAMDNEAAPGPGAGAHKHHHTHSHTSKRSQAPKEADFKFPKP